MPHITASEASSILKISKRTLFRWEKEGKIRSKRDGVLATRVYDSDYIETVKNILTLDKKEKQLLLKLPEIRERVRNSLLEQDYLPGKPLRFLTDAEVETSMKAFDDEEEWMREHKQVLSELFSFPIDIIRELLSPL